MLAGVRRGSQPGHVKMFGRRLCSVTILARLRAGRPTNATVELYVTAWHVAPNIATWTNVDATGLPCRRLQTL